MCSETNPRISFSNDLGEEDGSEIEQETRRDTTLLGSNSDFEFSFCSSVTDYESSLADELFADGMILPVHAHRHQHSPKVSLPPLPCPPPNSNKSSKREVMDTKVSDSGSPEKPPSKSFWGFKRSSSLNYDIKKSLICPLPLLSRSNSTGSSVPCPKPEASSKDTNKQNSQKQQRLNSVAKKLSASSASTYVYTFPRKPPLKKNYSGSHGNGVKISPVLNMPPPYIAKGAANLFGLRSFFCNGKEKNRK